MEMHRRILLGRTPEVCRVVVPMLTRDGKRGAIDEFERTHVVGSVVESELFDAPVEVVVVHAIISTPRGEDDRSSRRLLVERDLEMLPPLTGQRVGADSANLVADRDHGHTITVEIEPNIATQRAGSDRVQRQAVASTPTTTASWLERRLR